ncbi:MAG: DUF3365 domain-containing protein [Rubrivivax sp.]
MTGLRQWPLSVILALPWLVAFLASAALLGFAWSHQPEVEAVARARALADMADAYRLQVNSNGGVYVPQLSDAASDGQSLASVAVTGSLPDGIEQHTRLNLQDAFMAVQALGRTAVAAGAAAKLRVTSDSPLNSDSTASEFELQALRTMRRGEATELWAADGDQFRYGRALKADASCLLCHGEPAAAPPMIRTRFLAHQGQGAPAPAGFGYRTGLVVGLTSVAVDMKPIVAANVARSPQLLATLGAAACIALLGWEISRRLASVALRRRIEYAERVAAGDLDSAVPYAPKTGRFVGAEFQRLDLALERLHEGAFIAAEALGTVTGDSLLERPTRY